MFSYGFASWTPDELYVWGRYGRQSSRSNSPGKRRNTVKNMDIMRKLFGILFTYQKVMKKFIWVWLVYLGLVRCPTRWFLLFIYGFLYWSSRWRLGPQIGVCRLLWPLLRAGMAVLTLFLQNVIVKSITKPQKVLKLIPILIPNFTEF